VAVAPFHFNLKFFLEKIMSKEFDAIEINVDARANLVDQSLTQLDELSLTLIGGGSGTVSL
jgi:hypothetical protein